MTLFVQWVGLLGTAEWPPRSADSTPCDFACWGIIKDGDYAQNPRHINRLKELIEEEFLSLNDNIELCKSICRSVVNHC